MDIKEIERVVASVQHAVFRNANNVAAGVLRSRFRGAGLQFREHQVYAPGDDVRFIDWKLSARTEHTYVKTFEEDRNVEIAVVLDVGPASFYGSNGVTKLQMALEITALLFLLAGENHDQVRIILFLDGERTELPAASGREGLVQFIATLEKLGLAGKGKVSLRRQWRLRETPAAKLLTVVKHQLARRKEVLYLGDMLSFPTAGDIRKVLADPRFHGVRLLSPIDEGRLDFPVPVGGGRQAGLAAPPSEETHYKRFPVVKSDERYLEAFLRRMR
jgi:uncharacterized protein (DUF58 family)